MIDPRNPHHMAAIGKVQQGGIASFYTHYDCLRIFHHACQQRGLSTVGDIREVAYSRKLLVGRAALIHEEVNKELMPLLAKCAEKEFISLEQKAELLDHIVDSVYVLLGLAVNLGLPFNEGFYHVHVANMKKIGMEGPIFYEEGNPEGMPAGKLKKPEGWTPPPMFDLIKEFYTQAVTMDSHQRGPTPALDQASQPLAKNDSPQQ